MGLHDRDYYREPQSTGLTLRAPQSVTVMLIIANVAVFLANILVNTFSPESTPPNWLTDHVFSVTPDVLTQPLMWWKLLTCGFGHSPSSILHLLFNMWVLFMFGRSVEPIYRRWEFLTFYLVAVLLGSIFWVLRSRLIFVPDVWPQISMLGASGAVMAVLILYVMHFPTSTILLFFIIPVPAWVLGILLVVLNVVTAFGSEHIAWDVHLVGAAFGFLYFMSGFRFTSFGFGRGRLDSFKRFFRRRPKLRVHDPALDDGRERLEEEADRVLEKLHREGEESLSSRERQILEDYSRRIRQKLR